MQHQRQLRPLEGRELFEVHEVLHEDHLTGRDAKFLKKQVAEIAAPTVSEPGQARLVEHLFGVVVPLAELDEEIDRVRKLKDDPRRKERLKLLLSMKDSIEPKAEGINADAGPLKRAMVLCKLLNTHVVGAGARQTPRLSANTK